MAFLTDQFTGALARRRDRTATDAGSTSEPSGRRATGKALRRLPQGRLIGLMLRAGLMTVSGGALVWVVLAGAEAVLAARGARATAAIATAAPPAWSAVIRPIPIFDLGGTDFAKLPRSYEARRHAPDGTREDVMSFGTFGDGKPYLRIALARRGDGPPEPEGSRLADALARIAGPAGATVTRLRPLPPVETRFGALERADITLSLGTVTTACQGFRAVPDGGDVLTLTGLACRAADRPLAENAGACVADKVDLLSAGDDRALRALFVAAARRPGAMACGGGVLAASAAPPAQPGPFAALRRRAAWLEAGSGGPPLRGPLDAANDER